MENRRTGPEEGWVGSMDLVIVEAETSGLGLGLGWGSGISWLRTVCMAIGVLDLRQLYLNYLGRREEKKKSGPGKFQECKCALFFQYRFLLHRPALTSVCNALPEAVALSRHRISQSVSQSVSHSGPVVVVDDHALLVGSQSRFGFHRGREVVVRCAKGRNGILFAHT